MNTSRIITVKDFQTLFCEHPESVGESYFETPRLCFSIRSEIVCCQFGLPDPCAAALCIRQNGESDDHAVVRKDGRNPQPRLLIFNQELDASINNSPVPLCLVARTLHNDYKFCRL